MPQEPYRIAANAEERANVDMDWRLPRDMPN